MKIIFFILAFISILNAQQLTDFYKLKINGLKYNIVVNDIKNGYIKAESAEYEGYEEFVMWKRKSGVPLFASAQFHCGPGCEEKVEFFEIQGKTLKNISNQIFPEKEIENEWSIAGKKYNRDEITPWIILPKVGTTLKIGFAMSSDSGVQDLFVPILDYNFDGSKFILAKKYNDLRPIKMP